MSLTFCTLFSGSSGNAVFLGGDEGSLLIDCGMSCKQVMEAMREAGLQPSTVSALLITHEHSDHVKGAGILSRQLHIPIFATQGTWMGMEKAIGPVSDRDRVVITAGESFFLSGFEVVPFSIPHDANDPVGYRFYHKRHSVAVATDLGHFSQTVADALYGTEVVLLESNHDPDLLRRNPHYPARLKSRILGKKGHLSNEDGAGAAVWLAESGAKHLLLGHLSNENNTPDMAYRTTHAALTAAGARVGEDVSLHIAARYRASYLYQLV
ncbi:MAG: MBL fold metallo-hydrolase [Clostridiales bacterium]|nr:MBL fold metallo-hydrolase [Clostridiales bacterium]